LDDGGKLVRWEGAAPSLADSQSARLSGYLTHLKVEPRLGYAPSSELYKSPASLSTLARQSGARDRCCPDFVMFTKHVVLLKTPANGRPARCCPESRPKSRTQGGISSSGRLLHETKLAGVSVCTPTLS